MANRVYDDKADQERAPLPDDRSLPPSDEGLRHITGISPEEEAGIDRRAAHSGRSKDSLTPRELQDREESASEDGGFASGFSDDNPNPTSRSKSRFRITRRRALIGGGALAGAGGIGVTLFFLLIPLKIEHIVNNLQSHFFATSENAVENETDNMLKQYLKIRVKACGNTVDKNCNVNISGSSPVSNLYRTWSQAKLENTLADKYGIEITYDKSGKGAYRLKAPGTTDPKGDVIGSSSGIDSAAFDKEMSRSEVRQAVNNALQNETQWKQVMYRFKVGRLLEEKYGIKRCIVFCGQRDALTDKTTNKKYAAKLFLVERVVAPRNAALGAVLACLLNTSCDNKAPTTCTEPSCDELAGESQTEADAETEKAVGKVASGFGSETAATLVKTISDSRAAGGFQNYVLQQTITKIFNQDISEQAVPVVGQLQMLSQLSSFIDTLSNAPQKLKKLSYITNSTAAVSLYMMYRTYADEIHTGSQPGKVDATEVGSFVSSLGPGSQCDPSLEGKCGAQAGGIAGAESTPLYSSLIDGNTSASSSTSTSFLDNLFPSTAYAASTTGSSVTSSDYKCAGGKGVPAGSLVCPEEVLGQTNGTIKSVSSTLQATGLTGLANAYNGIPLLSTVVNGISSVTSWITGGLAGALEGAFEFLPGASSVVNEMKSLANTFFQYLTNQLIPSPFSDDMSGGRTFDMMTAGADVSGNDYAHTGLGGQRLNSQQVAEITNQQESEAQQQFSHQPFFARMFSTDSPYSLVSKIAMDMPDNRSSVATSFATFMGNPFAALTHSFAAIFSGNASAAAVAQPDAFGVTQYGYPEGTIPSDPETYWDQHCSDNAAQAYQNDADYQKTGGGSGWNGEAASSTPDPDNGMPVNTTTNPCMLIKASVGSAGGAFDTSLLTQDDLADLNGGSSSSTGSSTSSPSGPGCGGSGKYSALVGTGSSFAGVDQGIDFVPSGGGGFDICAPAPGTITLADQTGHHFNRTTGQAEIIEKLDQPSNAPSSSQYIYYAEIIQINSNIHIGTHVNKGDIIGHNAQSPGIEVGWGQSPSEGFLCPIGYPTPCGTSFDSWVQGL